MLYRAQLFLFFAGFLFVQAAIVCHASQIPPPRNRPGRTSASSSNRANERAAATDEATGLSGNPSSSFLSAVSAFRIIQKEQLLLAAANNASARVLVYRICCGEMGNRFLVSVLFFRISVLELAARACSGFRWRL
jgi:hypothetical protein